MTCPCCGPLGACCTNGVCTQTTQGTCAGRWQGPGTVCSPQDQCRNCCFPDGTCGSDGYFNCRQNVLTSKCVELLGTSGACNQPQVHPGINIFFCDDGGPTQATVTVTGATATIPEYQAVADACNGSFIVDLTCGGGIADEDRVVAVIETTLNVGGPPFIQNWTITLEVSLSGSNRVTASISASAGGSAASTLANIQESPFALMYINCKGVNVYDCSTYQLPAGGSAAQTPFSAVDFTNATIALA